MPENNLTRLPRRNKQFALTVGESFERWTVVGPPIEVFRTNGGRSARYLCRCACGTEKIVPYCSLIDRASRSCGCLKREVSAAKERTHGGTGTRLYVTWQNMRSRCFHKSYRHYHNYGGRGIRPCEEWLDFETFRDWALSSGYTDEMTLDRKDPDGNYEPDNCRWIPASEQARTMRKCRFLTAFGETKTIREWSRDSRCTVSHHSLTYRVNHGWADEAAITETAAVNGQGGRGGR